MNVRSRVRTDTGLSTPSPTPLLNGPKRRFRLPGRSMHHSPPFPTQPESIAGHHPGVTGVSPKCHENVTKCHQNVTKMSRDVTKCREVSRGVTRCHGVSRSVTEVSQCHKMSPSCHQMSPKCHQNVTECHGMSQNVTKCRNLSPKCHRYVTKCHNMSPSVTQLSPPVTTDHRASRALSV